MNDLGGKPIQPTAPTPQMRPPPAFQCYASDWMADERYILATPAQRGVLISFLNYCWVNGTIPADPTQAAVLTGMESKHVEDFLRSPLSTHFSPNVLDVTRLRCRELQRQQESMRQQAANRAAGGRKGGMTTQARVRERTEILPSIPPSSPAQASEKRRDEQRRTKMKPAVRDNVSDDDFVRDYERESDSPR